MSIEGSKELASDYGLGGAHNMLHSEQSYRLHKEVPSAELLNIQAKKASRRGKMSHVTKLLNNIYRLIETSGSIRELERVINSLNEAFSGFVKRHDEYIAVLTSERDEIEMDLAIDKLVEIEEKIANCKWKAEQYISAQQKELESQSRGSQEEKCLLSVSTRSHVSLRKKSTYTHLSKEQEHRSRKRLDEVKERHQYEEKLQDLKFNTLKREMQIRRELEIRQAERDLESCGIAKSSSSRSKNSSNPQSVADQSPKAKKSSLPDKVSVELPAYSSHGSKAHKSLPPRAVSTWNTPLVLGEKTIPLGTFEGKKESWLRFFQTFKAVVDNQPYDPIVKFAILEKHLMGPAKDCIRGFPFTENSYPLVLKALQDRFGDEEDQASFYLGTVENLPKIKSSDVPGLRKFYDDLNTNIQVLENMGPDVAMHLNDPRRMKLLSTKLPRNLAIAWATYQDEKGIGSDMRAFTEWLRKKVQILERVEVQPQTETGDKRVPGKQFFKPHVHVTTQDGGTQTERTETKLQIERGKCWVCRDGNHWPGQCLVLKKMTVHERKQLVKQNGACFKCLLRGHLVAKCRRKVGCLIENCKGTHHTLLHQENLKNPAMATHNAERKSSETSSGEQLARNEETPRKETLSVTSNANRSCLKREIVALPVKKIDILNGYGQRVTINCLEDSGSQVTLITHRLVESLGLTARRSNQLTLSGVGDQNIKLNSEVSFLIQAKDNELSIPMTAYAIPKISNYSAPLDVDEIKQKFHHLQDVDVFVDKESVDLLIGQNYPILLRQLETRYGKPDEPYAVRTVLGWSICGPVDERVGEDPSIHLISSCSPPTTSVDDFNLKRFWEIEQIPVKKPSLYTPKEQKILEETERTTCQVNRRYQVKLPWKDSTKRIPDSYEVALRRLESIERRMRNQPSLKEKYGKVIEDYVADGYLEKLPEKPSDTGWYLPHHPVISEDKNTKLRIVFDSSAKTDGISLNDLVEKGPCLLNGPDWHIITFPTFQNRHRRRYIKDVPKSSSFS
jgi:hypothetical protein